MVDWVGDAVADGRDNGVIVGGDTGFETGWQAKVKERSAIRIVLRMGPPSFIIHQSETFLLFVHLAHIIQHFTPEIRSSHV